MTVAINKKRIKALALALRKAMPLRDDLRQTAGWFAAVEAVRYAIVPLNLLEEFDELSGHFATKHRLAREQGE